MLVQQFKPVQTGLGRNLEAVNQEQNPNSGLGWLGLVGSGLAVHGSVQWFRTRPGHHYNLHHAHCAKSQSPCICTLALEAPSCLVGALTMCPHLPSTSGNIPHCTCTSTHTPSLAALPHLDVPIHPCFPLPGGLFTTNQP